jgi:hypothetical protein
VGAQFHVQKIPVRIRHLRAQELTRNSRVFLMTLPDGVLLITGFLWLGLLSLVLAAPAWAAYSPSGPAPHIHLPL